MRKRKARRRGGLWERAIVLMDEGHHRSVQAAGTCESCHQRQPCARTATIAFEARIEPARALHRVMPATSQIFPPPVNPHVAAV